MFTHRLRQRLQQAGTHMSAHAQAKLLKSIEPTISQQLEQIEYSPVVVVLLICIRRLLHNLLVLYSHVRATHRVAGHLIFILLVSFQISIHTAATRSILGG